jgi:hypothetical protein
MGQGLRILKTLYINGAELHTDRFASDDLRLLNSIEPGTYLGSIDVVETKDRIDIVYLNRLNSNAVIRRAAIANWRTLADLLNHLATGGDPAAPVVSAMKHVLKLA